MSTIPKREGNNKQNLWHVFFYWNEAKDKKQLESYHSKSILKTDQKHLPFEELFLQKTNTHTHKKKQNPKTNKQAFLLDW